MARAMIAAAAAEKRRQDEAQVAALVAKGTPAIRLVYQDGGQHQKEGAHRVRPEIAAKALSHRELYGICRPLIVGDARAIIAGARAMGFRFTLMR